MGPIRPWSWRIVVEVTRGKVIIGSRHPHRDQSLLMLLVMQKRRSGSKVVSLVVAAKKRQVSSKCTYNVVDQKEQLSPIIKSIGEL